MIDTENRFSGIPTIRYEMNAAGIEMNLYYRFLIRAFERFQAINQYFYIAGGEIYDAPREDDKEITEMFAAVQYNKLFGEGYLDDVMSCFS